MFNLCIAHNLTERNAFDPKNLAARFLDWYNRAIPNKVLCRIARRRGSDTVISVESEATDSYDIGNPPLHPRISCEG